MSREIQVRTIPATIRRATSEGKIPEKIGLRELMMGEQEEVAESVKSGAQLPFRMLRKSLAWVRYEGEEEGHKIDRIKAEDEMIFLSFTPQTSTLLAQAFAEMHDPKPEEQAAFLGSLEVIQI